MVTGGFALAEALRGWSALSWRDAIFRGGLAQRIRSTETTAGESTMGFQVAWSGEKKLLLYRRKAKKRDTTLSSEGNDQSAGNGSIKTNCLGLCFLSSSLVKCQAGLKQSKEEEEGFWKKEKKKTCQRKMKEEKKIPGSE